MGRKLTNMEKAVFGEDAEVDIFDNPIEQGYGALPVKTIPWPETPKSVEEVPLEEYREDEMPDDGYDDFPDESEKVEPVKTDHKKKKGK